MKILITEDQVDRILLSENYSFQLKRFTENDIYVYKFENKDGYEFEVVFSRIDNYTKKQNYSGYERFYKALEKNGDSKNFYYQTNSGDPLKIIATLTKITEHFLENVKPEFVKIYHIPSKRDVERSGGRFVAFDFTEKTSQRALLNKRFLEKSLPDNYVYILKGSLSYIIRNDSGLLEDNYFKQDLMESYSYSKLDNNNTYTFKINNIRFNTQFRKNFDYPGLITYHRNYYINSPDNTMADPFDEINLNKPFSTIKTITKITIDFLNEVQPDLLIIKHIYKNKNDLNIKGKTQEDRNTNQRALLNKRFLERDLPENYLYYLVGINSIIIKKDREVLKKIAQQNIFGVSHKIDNLLTESSRYYDNLENRLKQMGFEDGKEIEKLIDLAKNGHLGEYLQTQGKVFNFGLLHAIFNDALIAKKKIDLRSGVIKMAHRMIPMALAFKYPIAAIVGYILGTSRAFNKVIAPLLADPGKSYPDFLKKLISSTMKIAEGEYVEFEDHFSKAFVVSDDIIKILNPEILHKFALYLSEKMAKENPNKEVPNYYIENELRKYLNRIYELNPPLPLKVDKN